MAGINTIEGQVKYPEGVTGSPKIIVKAYDMYNPASEYKKEIYGLGYYKIENVPDIQNCVVEAFVDYNWDWMANASEPKAKSSAFSIASSSGVGGKVTKDLELAKQELTKTSIITTIRISVTDENNPEASLSGADVIMYDPGNFDDWMPENDVFISSKTTTAWKGTGYNKYNVEFPSVTVTVSPDGGPWYNYQFKVIKNGYKFNSIGQSFSSWDNSQVKNMYISMKSKPAVTVSNIDITPASKEITPDNDGNDDRASFKFKYSVATTQPSWDNGAQAKLIIDTNKDGKYEPMNWSIFVYIDGKQFIKWNAIDQKPDPNIFIDFMNPDYTKLKGPISWEEQDKYSAGYDATMEWWIDSWNLKLDGNSMSQDVEMVWEGRDNRWQPLKNSTYNWKLQLNDQSASEAKFGVLYSTTGVIKIKTSSIKGYVMQPDGTTPIEGAKVNAGGPMAWGETYTDSTGLFEIAGLRVSGTNEFYFLSAEAKGFTRKEMNNLVIPASGTLTLTDPIKLDAGVKLSGNLIIPNPPKKGSLRDNMGNQIFDLWGRVEVWRTDGPGWYSAEVRVPLSSGTLSQLSAPYDIYLEPGNFSMQVNLQGYVSKTIDIEIKSAAKTQDVEMTKSAVLTGVIKLPVTTLAEVTALQEEAQKKGYWGGLWMNIHGESKDRKFSCGTGISFDFFELQNSTTYAKNFMMDTLIPGTTYTFTVESNGVFAMNQFTLTMPKSGVKNVGTISLGYGAKLTGSIVIGDVLGEKIEAVKYGGGYTSMMGTTPVQGVPIWLDIQNTNTYSYHGTEVRISSSAAGTYSYEIRGLSSGWHEIDMHGIQGADITPSLESRKVYVSTVTNTMSNPAIAPTITIKNPTGILKGAITNSSGKDVDWTKVAVTVVTLGKEGGSPTPLNVESDGTFTVNELMTTDYIVWGTEYDVKPGEGVGMFGVPSGKVSTFMKLVATQSGGATTYLTADLKPASTIYLRLYSASPATITDIIAKTTTYMGNSDGQNFGISRIQSITLRKLAEQMEQMESGSSKEKVIVDGEEIDTHTKAKEIAFEGILVESLTTANTVVFKLNGLEKGIYFAYPMVNFKMIDWNEQGNTGSNTGPNTGPTVTSTTGGSDTMGGTYNYGPRYKVVEYAYASSPMDKYIVLDENTEEYADFTLGDGLTLNGSITRPSGNYTSAQTVEVTLRNAVTNDAIYTKTVTYSTTTRVNTQSYTFDKVGAGKYILVAKSADYKVYTKSVEVTKVTGTDTLSAIKLTKGATLTGQIVNEDGTGISEGAYIQCEAYPYVEGSYMNSGMSNVTISSETATRGVFTFPNLPGGTYQVKASMTSGAKLNLVAKVKAGITVPDSETTVDVGSLILKKATSIKGTVKNTSGTPLSNIRVQAYPLDSQRKENNELETKTDKDGVFMIKGVDSSIKNWSVKVNAREEDPTKRAELKVNYGTALRFIDVTAKTDLGTISLSASNASVAGTVKTPDNSQITLPFPVEGINNADFPAALVILQSQEDLATGDPMSGTKVISAGSGEFVIDGVVSGNYTLKIFAKKFATYSSTVTVKAGINELGDIMLAKGATVSGSIRTQTGKKVSKSDASMVVAATRDFKKVVFGSLAINPTTLEVDNYEIVGLEPGVNYFLVLVAPQTGKVYVDLKSTAAATNATYINHPIVYKKIPPMFEAKAFKTTLAGSILKGEMTIQGQTIKFKGIFDDYDVDLSQISTTQTYDIYFILSFISQPVMEETAGAIVSTTTASTGVYVPMSLADSRKALSIAYIPSAADITAGYFELKFSGRNSEGLVGNDTYKFYIGEDGRSEKVVNPMIGGNIALGEGDSTGIDVPSGVEFEGSDNDIAISSGVKAQVIKVLSETVVLAGPGTRFGPKKYAPQCFSTKLANPSSYPTGGTLMSSIYDLQVKLVSGPLATIASNSSVGVKIQISSAALNVADQNDLGLYHYDTGTSKWVPEATGTSAAANIDWSNLLLSMNVSHFSKFAVFYVPGSAPVVVSSSTVATDLSNVIFYPNPYKSGVTSYDGADGVKDKINIKNLTARAKLKIYNIAGELVGDYDKNDATSGTLQWDMMNKDDKKLASGVYIYYITNPDNSAHKAVGKFAIIK
ncbi:MAG: carboxypeptidase regulatory-like domain-containing protein [Elusimicrobia bacterium]|nr:carboxypeptidase regulatory-like domain-containing protein [Candidatus Liberimonas magnetica]